MHYNVFQSVRHPKSALSVWASTPHVIGLSLHIPWTHPTPHFKLHLGVFSRFRTAHGRYFCNVSYIAINARLA